MLLERGCDMVKKKKKHLGTLIVEIKTILITHVMIKDSYYYYSHNNNSFIHFETRKQLLLFDL